MNKYLKKISALIDEIDSIENADEYDLLSNQIKDELFNIFSTVSTDVFITTISIKVLKPIQEKLNVAINFIQTKRSRSYISKRPKILLKRDFLIDLRNQILIDYKEQLKETELYKDFVINEANSRFLILNPTKDYPIEIFTTKQFENVLKISFSEIINYFDESQLANSNYKDEIYLFVEKANRKLKELSNRIGYLKKVIDKNQSEDFDFLFDLHSEVKLLKLQETYLLNLIKEIENTHFFLKIYTPKKETPLTVFGGRDVNKLEQLYFELEHFLDKSTQVEDIINVFSLDYVPLQKINLQNGTLNDFAYLMDKMQPYFVVDIADRNYYNQWWADRFTFKGKEKTKKGISTIISNTKNDASRKPQKATRINSIVDVLK